jgi:AcrR family transcriptional regulator
MRDIAARAGVSMTTVYDHFPSKIHLLVTALDGDLLDFATRVGDTMDATTDPFARLRHVVDELLWGMQSSDRMTETFTHAYAAAYTMAIPEADAVRARTVELFSAALANQSRPDPTHDMAEILTDVWTCEIFGLVQERSTFADFRHRLLVTIDMLAKATSPS